MKEHAVEKHLRLRTQELGGWALKFVSPGNAGVPDRLTILPTAACPCCGRRSVAGLIELKRPGKTPRELQDRQIERLREIGFPATWADTPDRVDEVLEDLRRARHASEDCPQASPGRQDPGLPARHGRQERQDPGLQARHGRQERQDPGLQARHGRQERSETLGGGLVSLGAPGALLRPSATFWGVRRG